MRPKIYFDNARLAVDLAIELGAKGTDAGSMSDFCGTPPEWHCPGCTRKKAQIARLDKNGNFYCATHLHHDHLYNGIVASLRINEGAMDTKISAAIDSLTRFPSVRLCMDCNMAEGRAKRLISAPEYFSFSEQEIYEFITVRDRRGHVVDEDNARRAYILAKDHFEDRLQTGADIIHGLFPKSVDNAKVASAVVSDGFERIGGAAWRVLKEVNRKRKERPND